MGHIHAADPAKSGRLKRVLDLLRSRGAVGATTREIIRLADVCAVNAIVPELRQNGFTITCETKLEGDVRVARYRLIEGGESRHEPQPDPDLPVEVLGVQQAARGGGGMLRPQDQASGILQDVRGSQMEIPEPGRRAGGGDIGGVAAPANDPASCCSCTRPAFYKCGVCDKQFCHQRTGCTETLLAHGCTDGDVGTQSAGKSQKKRP